MTLTKAQEYSAKINRRRTALRKIRYHVNSVLNLKLKEEKIRDYVRVFWKYYNIKTDENPKDWLYNIYVSGENEFIKREDNAFYSTREWRNLRENVLFIYGYKCMKCGYEDKSNCVDHIKPRSKFKELELELYNMQVLCRLCNLVKSNNDFTDYRG